MKKYTLNFGQFRQFDKKFITSENGINIEGVSSVAFLGEALYIAADGELFEYNEGKVKKLSGKADKLFSRGGRVYVSCGHSLGELKGGKIKKIKEFSADRPVR